MQTNSQDQTKIFYLTNRKESKYTKFIGKMKEILFLATRQKITNIYIKLTSFLVPIFN